MNRKCIRTAIPSVLYWIFGFYFFFFYLYLAPQSSIKKALLAVSYLLTVYWFVSIKLRQQKKLIKDCQESEEIYQTLFNLSLDAIHLETERGEIIACNRSGHEMFGYTKEEMLTKTIKDIVPDDFAATLPEVIPEEMTTGDVYVERVNKKKDGTLFPTEINTKFIKIGGQRRLIAYTKDITERKKLEEELRELTFKDELTKLYNRRFIFNQLEIELARVRREGIVMSLVLLDIDNFKEINDTYGHLCGDNVLRKLSEIIQDNIRKLDYAGRYGGEEFIIIFTATGIETAWEITERIREQFKKQKFDHENLKVSFSAGMIKIEQEAAKNRTIDDLIKEVDNLLYQGKNMGKDQIVKTG